MSSLNRPYSRHEYGESGVGVSVWRRICQANPQECAFLAERHELILLPHTLLVAMTRKHALFRGPAYVCTGHPCESGLRLRVSTKSVARVG